MRIILETIKIRDFWNLLASFLVILLIPVFFLARYHASANEAMVRQLEESSRRIIDHTAGTIDLQLRETKAGLETLASDPAMRAFLNHPAGYRGSAELYRSRDAARLLELFDHQISQGFLKDVMAFNLENGVCVSNRVKYADLPLLYGQICGYPSLDYGGFCGILEDIPAGGGFYRAEQAAFSDGRTDVLLYCYPVYGDAGPRAGYLLAFLRVDAFRKDFSMLDYGEESYLIVRDRQGSDLISIGSPGGTRLEAQSAPQVNDFVWQSAPAGSDFVYIHGVPKQYIFGQTSGMKTMLRLYMVLSIFGGILFALVLSITRIKPIGDFVHTLDPECRGFRWRLLSDNVAEIIRENGRIKERLDEQRILLKYELIDKLFRGDLSQLDQGKLRELLGFAPERYFYAAVLLFAELLEDERDRFLPAAEAALTQGELVHFLLPYAKAGEGGVFVPCLLALEQNDVRLLSRCLEGVESRLAGGCGAAVSVFCGSLVDQVQNVSLSRKEADFLCANFPGEGVLLHQLIAQKCQGCPYPLKTESKFIKEITDGNCREACALLDGIFSEHFCGKRVDLYDYQRFTQGVVNTLFRLDRKLLLENEKKVAGSQNLLNMKESFAQLRGLAQLVGDGFGKAAAQGDKRREQIALYIEQRYCEPEFTIVELADRFGMSYNQMYNYFKKTFSQTFAAYLEDKRLNRSIELLCAGERIEDIAQLCGYNSPYSYRRAFMKIVGIAPSEFREANTRA